MLAGPISGASINPAWGVAPALFSGQLEHLWICMATPITWMQYRISLLLYLKTDVNTNCS
ncbi:MAG: aquaporin [Bacteroidetes bacterium]|nr:aquaporin [Bacteroidota bacterium]